MRSPDFGRPFGFSKNFPDRHALIGGHRRSTLHRRGTDAARRLIDDAKQTRVVSIGKHAQVGNHILDFLTIKKAQSTVNAVRNAVGRKHTFEIARQIVIAIEDRKITVLFAATLFDEDILAILDKYDMKVTEVEYIVQWAEEHRSYEQKYKEQLCFHMCELFNVKQINCGLMENYSVEYTAQKLRELCHRAGKYIIGVEPMPYSGIPDMKKGWAVVKAADCENAKLIMDTWHWVRANQPVDLSVIEDIPADKIVSIQINDVWERPYATTILRDESMHDRLAPGTGIGCTAAFVKMVKEKGIKPNAIGVEVISDAILAKGLEYAANHTYENTKKVLEEAWPEVLQ